MHQRPSIYTALLMANVQILHTSAEEPTHWMAHAWLSYVKSMYVNESSVIQNFGEVNIRMLGECVLTFVGSKGGTSCDVLVVILRENWYKGHVRTAVISVQVYQQLLLL